MAAKPKERNGRRFRREPLALPARASSALRISLFFVVPVLSLILFPLTQGPAIEVPVAGQISTREIIAPSDFPVAKDAEVLEAERDAAAGAVPPVLDVDPTVAEGVAQRLARIERELMRPPADRLPSEELRTSIARQLGVELSPESVERLDGEQGAAVIDRARSHLLELLAGAVVPAEVSAVLAGKEVVNLRRGGVDFPRPASAVQSIDDARRAAEEAAKRLYPRDRSARRAFLELTLSLAAPNAIYDHEETTRRMEAARQGVEITEGHFKKGVRILDTHELITEEDVRVIRSLVEYQRRNLLTGPVGGSLMRNVGRFGALCLLLLALLTYLRSQQPHVHGDLRSMGVLATVGALAVIMAYVFVIHLHRSEILMPVAALPLLVALLLNRGVALFTALIAPFLFMILLIPNGIGLSPGFLIGSSVAGVAAVLAAENVRKRHEIYVPVILVAAAYVLVALTLGMALRLPVRQVAITGLNGALSAFLAGALTIALLPVLEKVFRVTTNFTLVELLDRNHPLMQRMAIEAPGTFHHSMMVAELAREAVAAIGGNALLAQVGAYYHDIGKMEKPRYFIENQTGKNVHDKLTPTMSSLVLGSHVREGVVMARVAGLPREIIDFIPEHHGTTLMSYFFHKARETDENVEEGDFRYPGPRPHSKETGIVMLADSVEATARSLDDPTPGTLRVVVRRLIDARIGDGQLDSSALTLADLTRVREAFVKVLKRFFHHRIQYPGQQELAGRRAEPVDDGRVAPELLVAPQGEEALARRERHRRPRGVAVAHDGTEAMVVPSPGRGDGGKNDDAHPARGQPGTGQGVADGDA